MAILVTGGSGFIGSHIARTLIDRGYKVFITGTPTENNTIGAQLISYDFNNIDKKILKQIKVVFHEAANNDTTDTDRSNMFVTNVWKPLQLFESLYDVGCRNFIYASSTAVYGDSPAPYIEETTLCKPLNPYAESKLAFENLVNFKDATVIGLRYCNVFGSNESHKGKRASMISQLISKMKQGQKPILFKYGEQQRDWIHVSDVVQANLQAQALAEFGVKRGHFIFNCGSGQCVTFNRIVEIINEKLKTNLACEYIDCPFSDAYQNHTQCDMALSNKILNFRPKYSIEEGIRQVLE